MATELCRIHSGCFSVPISFCPTRCDQNPYPEPKFREPREWVQDCKRDDEKRGNHEFLQGIGTEGRQSLFVGQLNANLLFSS